jgi:excisionase family DNA binding protein
MRIGARPGQRVAGSVGAVVTTIVVDGEEYLTGDDAARMLGVKPATLYAYVSRGILKSYREGTKRRRLYRRAEVEALRRLDRGRPPEIPPVDSWIRD